MKAMEKVFKKNNDIVSREIDNEMILMPIYKTNKDINEMYTLNESAAEMWDLMDGKRTLSQITDRLCEKYDVSRETVDADLQEFVKDMKGIKAIEPAISDKK